MESVVISIQIERMTVGLFAYWVKRDWAIITKGLYVLPNSATQKDDRSASVKVWWSDDNPRRFNRLTVIRWEEIYGDKIVLKFDGVGDESDVGFESFDPLSKQILGWLQSRFDIDI